MEYIMKKRIWFEVELQGAQRDRKAKVFQEYQMVCTRLDIASVDMGMLDKFDRGLQTDVHVFVDFDYAMERSITVMAGYMTFTDAWRKEIWLKGLLIESRYELRLVADCPLPLMEALDNQVKSKVTIKIVGEMSAEQRKVLLFFWTLVKYLLKEDRKPNG
nr:E3 ubiquitin-protein ligase UPL5 [Tanacetum cinerariifolium]